MKQIKNALRIVLPLTLAVIIFWWVYRDMDFSRLVKVFHNGIHYEWFIFSALLSILSMILRGLRWHQLVEPVCPGGRKDVIILSVFVGYAANMIFPRAGEVVRCGVLKKKDGLSFTKTLGTVITERVFDMICLLLITLATVFLQMGVFRDFFTKNPSSLHKLISMLTSPVLWGGFVFLLLLAFFLRKYIRQFSFYEKIHGFIVRLWEGMKSIVTLKHPLLFIFWSVAIWSIYFLMFYIGKYFFSFDIPLGVLAMLSGFVMGSFGVVAPVQGGIGAYHFMVIYTLVFFGISESDAGIFALVIHGLQMIITLLTGLIAYVWLQIIDQKSNKSVEVEAV